MLRDELHESWAYQEILQEGRQEGLIKAVLAIVEFRFPELLPQAKALLERERDVLILERLLSTLTLAQGAEGGCSELEQRYKRFVLTRAGAGMRSW